MKVKPSEMFRVGLKKRGEIIVEFEDQNGKSLRSNKYLVGREKGVIMEFVGNREDRECILKADVTNIYYNTEAEDYLEDYEVIKDSPTESHYIELPANTNVSYLVYPGFYEKALLPDTIPTSETVTGVFFVDCENIKNEENLLSDILGSIYFEIE